MLRPGEIVNGKYEIIGLVGRGGMSAVYRARSLSDGRPLAVKDVDRSKESGNQIFEARLTEEGQMLKRLSNTHLPRIYDIIENPSSFMLVMDFVEGESLDKVIARNGPQQEAYIYNWGMQICDVFTYLHSQTPPIIYRDMKPANIILQPDGKIMMIDFGTARTQKSGLGISSDTICIGTEGFAAPEQYGGLGQSDARTDIFCLGATLYNMITGHSPYDYPKGILPLERWDPALANSPLNAIISKCTQTSPLDRYQTAAELRADLELASKGRFKAAGRFSIAPGGWQRQAIKTTGALNGLSGLLQRTIKTDRKTEAPLVPKDEPQPEAPAEEKTDKPTGTQSFEPAAPKAPEWQKIKLVRAGAAPVAPTGPATQEVAPRPGDTPKKTARTVDRKAQLDALLGVNPWRRLMIIAAAAAIALLLLSAIFGLIGVKILSTILIVFSIAALALSVIGVVLFIRNPDAE